MLLLYSFLLPPVCVFVTVSEAWSYSLSTVEVTNRKAPFSRPPERKSVPRDTMNFVLPEKLLLFFQGVIKRLSCLAQGRPILSVHVIRMGLVVLMILFMHLYFFAQIQVSFSRT
jgi:hypothetical protein